MFRNPAIDVIVVLVIVLLFFGPKRLPGLGKSLGTGIREFKTGITGGSDHDDDKPELSSQPDEQQTTGQSAGAAAGSEKH